MEKDLSPVLARFLREEGVKAQYHGREERRCWNPMAQSNAQLDEKWPLSSLSSMEMDEVLEALCEFEREIEEQAFEEDPLSCFPT
jgi:hypothetical protein